MSEQTERKIVKSWQALLMLAVGIAIIIVGLMVMKLNNRIVLAVDGVIMCLMAWCFGVPYDDLQKGIKDTITSMIVAILILLAVGVLVGTWMISGTVPVMIYYGMQVIDCGVAILSMHAPWEIASCKDIINTKNAYKAFLTLE